MDDLTKVLAFPKSVSSNCCQLIVIQVQLFKIAQVWGPCQIDNAFIFDMIAWEIELNQVSHRVDLNKLASLSLECIVPDGQFFEILKIALKGESLSPCLFDLVGVQTQISQHWVILGLDQADKTIVGYLVRA